LTAHPDEPFDGDVDEPPEEDPLLLPSPSEASTSGSVQPAMGLPVHCPLESHATAVMHTSVLLHAAPAGDAKISHIPALRAALQATYPQSSS
jgi:hypothetical protein